MLGTPLAIVLSKADQPGIRDLFSDEKVKAVRRKYKGLSDSDANDILARAFLKAMEMDNFLNLIDLKFKRNRFFICSAIGHTREKGAYEPKGAVEPIEWIMRLADSKIETYWHDTEFSARPEGT
jgi:hypothetical protein